MSRATAPLLHWTGGMDGFTEPNPCMWQLTATAVGIVYSGVAGNLSCRFDMLLRLRYEVRIPKIGSVPG
jgi:hypothetical protein